MSNETVSEDRLTKNEFAELIQHLSVQEIVAIEYRVGSTWDKLFSRKNVSTNTFDCNLCIVETSSFKNLLAHIDGKKHKMQMERVKELYHADYTYPKTEKKELNEKTEKKNSKSFGKSNKDMTTCKDSAALLTSQPPLNSFDSCKEDAPNIENKSSQNKANASIPIQKNEGKQHEKVKSSCNETDKGKILSEKKMEEIKKPNYDQNKPSKECEKTKSINLEESLQGTKTNDTVAEKRRINNETSEVKIKSAKKAKMVLNPAAALSLKNNSVIVKDSRSKDSEEKPQYQKDKIIIPTMHKNKSSNDKASPPSSQSKDLPKFSVKSYSSQPSENDVFGILGVEYVIKILKNRNDTSPRYECGLCELVLDGFAMQRHLEGYNHRLKFCEKHFPTALRHYRQYMQNVPEHDVFKVMTPVLAKLAIAIEQHHGRNLPYECYERDFSLYRHEILAKAFSCRHASEQYGPTFTHVVGAKEIDEFINGRQNYLPPTTSRTAIFDSKPGNTSRLDSRHDVRNADKDSVSRNQHRHAGRDSGICGISKHKDVPYKSYLSSAGYEDLYPQSNVYQQSTAVRHVDDETYNLMVDDFLKGTLKGISGNSRLRDHHRKRSISPTHTLSSEKRKSISPLRQNDIWQAYRHMVDQELHNLDDRFKQYRKDPENHPSYNAEWQKFWKRRKDELISAGLDHRNYNFQPEWVRYIKIRIEELYSHEVENIKYKSRERLCLPMTNDNISDVKYHVHSQNNPSLEVANSTSSNAETITTKNVSISSNDSTPQVVSVLRLMTALEDSLGSLGPKIIDLLSKALQAEKINPMQVNSIILNDENCSLIETAKEKFRGLVITGLFERSKDRVLRQVINDTENLLKYAHQLRELSSQHSLQNNSFLQSSAVAPTVANVPNALFNIQQPMERATSKPTASKPLIDNLLTRMDKKELASKLAASLVAQGKTDFDPQQLQQLIAVYTLLEKKKRATGGAVLTYKDSLLTATSSSKKTLSDTLADLLKPSSSSLPSTSKMHDGNSSISNQPNFRGTLGPVQRSHNQMISATQFSTGSDGFQQNNFGSAAGTSVSQNSNANSSKNTAQSINNVSSVVEGGNATGRAYSGSHFLNNQNALGQEDMYNNQYQNKNRMTQNWRWNSNMEVNPNYNMDGSNNYNQNSNWQSF